MLISQSQELLSVIYGIRVACPVRLHLTCKMINIIALQMYFFHNILAYNICACVGVSWFCLLPPYIYGLAHAFIQINVQCIQGLHLCQCILRSLGILGSP